MRAGPNDPRPKATCRACGGTYLEKKNGLPRGHSGVSDYCRSPSPETPVPAKRYDFRFSPEVGEALDMVGHRNRTGWTGAAIMGTMAMARAAAKRLHACGDTGGDGDPLLAAEFFQLAEAIGCEFQGHAPLVMLVDWDTGRHKVALLAEFRELNPLTVDEITAVLVMAWVRNVDPKLFARMATGE